MSVLSGLWNDVTGKTAADASNAAAADTYKKQTAAVGDLNNYAAGVPGQYNALGVGYDPYKQAGGSALQMLMSGLGLGGAGGSKAFTDAYRSLPGYQASIDAGTQAAMRGANAGNMLQSGRTLKALDEWGRNKEDQLSGNYLAQLMGLTGQGQQAVGAQAGIGAQGLGQQANLRGSAFGGQMNAAGTIGQGQVAGAQAQQQGVQGLLNTGTNLAGGWLGGGAKIPSGTVTMPNSMWPSAYSPLPTGRA